MVAGQAEDYLCPDHWFQTRVECLQLDLTLVPPLLELSSGHLAAVLLVAVARSSGTDEVVAAVAEQLEQRVRSREAVSVPGKQQQMARAYGLVWHPDDLAAHADGYVARGHDRGVLSVGYHQNG